MRLHRSRTVLAIICCLALGSVANAVDLPVTGEKLLLKDKPKMVLLSKDMAVVPGLAGSSSDPRCVADGGSGSGASVTLSNGVDTPTTLNMPCANWSANGDGTIYKYKDKTGAPKVGQIKDGLLKVVSPGLGGFPVPNGNLTVTAEVTVGPDKYCMSFIGDGDGTKYVVKDQVAPASCSPPPPPVCTGQLVGGFCWFLGAPGASCDTTCAALALSCDPATAGYVGFPAGTLAGCNAVLTALIGSGYAVDVVSTQTFGCASTIVGPLRFVSTPTTCGGGDVGVARVCACM